VSECKLKYTFN